MWQPLKQYWQKSFSRKVIVVLTIAFLIFLVISIVGGYVGSYYFSWAGVGDYSPPPNLKTNPERGKTLWDWLDLLIIPLVLAIGGFLLNRAQRQNELDIAAEERETERQIAKDREEERALQGYLEAMTRLLLEEGLRTSDEDSEVRSIARARTLTVLGSLNGERKGSVLRFLYEAKLIDKEKTVIDLAGANLERANLFGTDLLGADLERANLCGADLRVANLMEANLRQARLGRANLRGACLREADLRLADLREADLLGVFGEVFVIEVDLLTDDLLGIDLLPADLRGAKYSTGTMWPEGFTPPSSAINEDQEQGQPERG